VYLYDAVTRTQKAFSPLVTSDPTEDGRFGWSVAVGEGLITVGAPFENIVGTGGYAGPSGRVYIYDATTGELIDTVTSGGNAEFYGHFGSSVAVGNGVIAIGAPDETVGGNDEAGRAYIYDLTSETITYTLVSQNSQNRGLFGNSVAVGDGVVVVGAIIEDINIVNNDNSGNAYAFNAGTGAYTETLTNPDPTEWTEFGWSVAVNGVNGMIAVGAYDAVFLFE
jgi:hypothetical protein